MNPIAVAGLAVAAALLVRSRSSAASSTGTPVIRAPRPVSGLPRRSPTDLNLQPIADRLNELRSLARTGGREGAAILGTPAQGVSFTPSNPWPRVYPGDPAGVFNAYTAAARRWWNNPARAGMRLQALTFSEGERLRDFYQAGDRAALGRAESELAAVVGALSRSSALRVGMLVSGS